MLLSHCSETFVLIYAFRAVQPSKFWETEQFITCNGQAVTGIVSADWVRENRQEFAELTKEASVEGGVGNDIDGQSAMDIT